MSTEQILMALVGGTGGAEPCGLLMDGYCVALAATEGARHWIEAIGEDQIGQWLEGAGVDPPGAGGLWVLQFDLQDDDEADFPQLIDPSWRCALPDEIAGLIERQSYRASRQTAGNPPVHDGRWTFLGALV
jgi:hypothetical protein